MNVLLPASIEAYLRDAGFSATEILLMQKLLQEDALSQREISLKTGKSTGVLDQAMKKLMSKKILEKTLVNGQPRYALLSLESIVAWVEHDRRQRDELVQRRHQDFASFIATLKHDKRLPEMQHFEDERGIMQAYLSLLKHKEEILAYMPITMREEDDPFRAFKTQCFRERRKRRIFLRVIAPDTPLGRRYQSRDPFEYRKTVLLPPDACPIPYDKFIVADTVLCITENEKRACLLHYPELAQAERSMFEAHWHRALHGDASPSVAKPEYSELALKTRVMLGLREYATSGRSLMLGAFFCLCAAMTSFGLYQYNAHLNLQRVRDRVTAIAMTGVLEIDAQDINTLHVEGDYRKPEYAKVTRVLQNIRQHNTDIVYAYIFRHSSNDPKALEFVADADSLNPYANLDSDPTNDVDANHDGKIEPNGPDNLSWPGQHYPTPPPEAFLAFAGPTSNSNAYTDSWGTTISGYAPIKDANGVAVAVLAVDVKDTNISKLFDPMFLVFAALFSVAFFAVLLRLVVSQRGLCRNLLRMLTLRHLVWMLLVPLCLSAAMIYGLYRHSVGAMKTQIAEQLMTIASTASGQFDPADLAQLHIAEDMKHDAYQRVFRALNAIRRENPDIKNAYIMRKSFEPDMMEFVADADSNTYPIYYLDHGSVSIEPAPPGTQYDTLFAKGQIFAHGLEAPQAADEFYTDKWGTYLTGSAPIFDRDAHAVAFVGLDMDISNVRAQIWKTLFPWMWLIAVVPLGIFSLTSFLALRRITRQSAPASAARH